MADQEQPFGELIGEFIAECLPLAEEVLDRCLRLERLWEDGDPGDDILAPVKGLLHTIKGNSAMMGLDASQHLAHTLEDLCGRLSEAPQLRGEAAGLLVRGSGLLVDGIREAASPSAPGRGPEAYLAEARSLLESATAVPERRMNDRRVARGPGEVGADGAIATIRVDSSRLDYLLETFGEAMIAQAGVREALRSLAARRRTVGEVATLELATLALEKTLKRLESALMQTRLVPIAAVFGRFNRLVRDLSRDGEKRVCLEVAGGETRLDKTVIDRLGEPLVHLVTNAVIHGIEPTAERARRGKPEEARITLAARQQSDRVILTVSDDGRGLDPDRILVKARALGLAPLGETPSLEEVYALAFLPGLSTEDEVSSLAGRGVGLDVVARSIRALGGTVQVTSQPGRGTTFVLRLPLTVAVLPSLLVSVERERYALPLSDIAETVRMAPAMIHEVARRGMVLWRGAVIPVSDAGQVLGLGGEARDRRYCVVLRSAARHRGLLVDRLLGHEEVVVKALDPVLGRPAGVSAATILGDGKVACILDTVRLADLNGAELGVAPVPAN
jgi:two-component system chemotaxis sensor kinase CheA